MATAHLRDLTLPGLEEFNTDLFNEETTLVCATGFEPRALNISSQLASRHGKRIKSAICVGYEPEHPGNLTKEVLELLHHIVGTPQNCETLKYTRFSPDDFYDAFTVILGTEHVGTHVVVDISAMSKFLILLTLSALLRTDKKITVVYSEADKYFPSQQTVEEELKTNPVLPPDFLTTGEYKIVSSQRISGVGMLGAPIMLVAFPSFNPSDIISILNEMPFQQVVLLYERTHSEENLWRCEALKRMHANISSLVFQERAVGVVDYREALSNLIAISEQYGNQSQLVISPTGSKMQTIGVALFKEYYPEAQFIYPPTLMFSGKLSEGIRKTWKVELGNANAICDLMTKTRKERLLSSIDLALSSGSRI